MRMKPSASCSKSATPLMVTNRPARTPSRRARNAQMAPKECATIASNGPYRRWICLTASTYSNAFVNRPPESPLPGASKLIAV
jgi:hypothetical protein